MAIALGIAAMLCWRNQTIRILSPETFAYITFLGNKKIYAFSEITGYTRNSDSFTRIARGEKIHIEACAIISERFAAVLDALIFDDPQS